MAASTSKPGFTLDEKVFSSLLTHINLSEERIFALTKLALRSLPQSADVWAAVRKAFVEQSSSSPSSSSAGNGLDSEHNKALWALVDSLMRSAPHIFLPIVLPRLQEYVVHQMPWVSMSWGEQDGSGRWWEGLVLSWENLLPPGTFDALRRHLLQQRSGAELDGAVAAASGGVGAPTDDGAPATDEDLHLLREEWGALRCLCEDRANAFSRELLLDSLRAAATSDRAEEGQAPGAGSPAAASAGMTNSNGKETKARGVGGDEKVEDEDDEEYVPEYALGAKPRELPSLGLPPLRRRREARRRFEEDEL
ncbi:unnamed protein product [Phytomonas sp. EM1]|nr:unnamed protein product [Phytomonas sp. EM1]|eukprot:CCW62643.1 unnamed protein product [Phytomonas sp. isolate EM1]